MSSFLDRMVTSFDALTLRFFSTEELKKRDQEFLNEDTGSPLTKAVYEASDSVDVKATAVLQHVSIMIAVTGILFAQAPSGLFRYVFAIEALLYVALALFCLRLLMQQAHSSTFTDTQNVTTKEAILELTAKLTFLVSIALILSVLLKLVLG